MLNMFDRRIAMFLFLMGQRRLVSQRPIGPVRARPPIRRAVRLEWQEEFLR